jgi:hypothetical protein
VSILPFMLSLIRLIDTMLVFTRKIVDGLHYYPEGKEIYSTTGCKRVAQKVSLYIADERYTKRSSKKHRTEL